MADQSAFDIVETRTVHRGFHQLDLVTVRQQRLDGSWTKPLDREVYRHRPSAGILLHDRRAGVVVLVEQLRLPAHIAGKGDRMIQIVAGMLDGGEAPEATVIRETREEAGLTLLAPPRQVVAAMTTPGAVSEVCTLFYGEVDATHVEETGGLASEDEETRIVVMSVSDMVKAMTDGRIFDGVTVLLGWWLQAHLLRGAIGNAG